MKIVISILLVMVSSLCWAQDLNARVFMAGKSPVSGVLNLTESAAAGGVRIIGRITGLTPAITASTFINSATFSATDATLLVLITILAELFTVRQKTVPIIVTPVIWATFSLIPTEWPSSTWWTLLFRSADRNRS
jgi:hypothetical protein